MHEIEWFCRGCYKRCQLVEEGWIHSDPAADKLCDRVMPEVRLLEMNKPE